MDKKCIILFIFISIENLKHISIKVNCSITRKNKVTIKYIKLR